MDSSRAIRDSLQAVAALRQRTAADASLRAALWDIKRMQSRRFSGTYADLLRTGTYAPAARFFLEELYGEKDYASRDEQFARIAGTIEKLFPSQVAATAADLAHLHALTEDLDVQMAHLWNAQGEGDQPDRRYVSAWRELGRRDERERQLEAVMALGHDMARLTRKPGLRTMLRMMRAPAQAAGLGALQQFLESGFDTFAGMSRQRGAVEHFLATVQQRERALLDLLYDRDLVACETEFERILGQAP